MKVLIFGDIYGRIGRLALEKEFPKLKNKYNPDFILSSVDNITSGRGPIEKHIKQMEKLGVDIMSGGDHIFDNLDKIENTLKEKDSKLLRPANLYEYEKYKLPGKGYKIIEKNGKRLLVIHLLGEVFMKHNVENPFIKVDKILKKFKKNENLDGIIIDFHKEVTSEGYAMSFFLDGKVSFIYGVHTHIQTNDDIIFPKGTGLISDVGMVGSLYSVIGADYNSVEKIFLTGMNKGLIKQSLDKNYIINGIYLEIGEYGNTEKIKKIKITGKL